MFIYGIVAALMLLAIEPAPEHSSAVTPVHLRWTAPAGCPEAEHVLRWIEELTPGTAMGARVVDVEVTIEAEGGHYVSWLAIEVGETSWARRLEADECALLARANAVVVAVSLDPLAVAETTIGTGGTGVTMSEHKAVPEVEREPQLEATAVAVAPPSTPVVAPPPPEAAPRLEVGGELGFGIGGLLLPSAGLGYQLAPFLGTRRFRVQASAEYWARRQTRFDTSLDVGGDLRLATGGVHNRIHW